MNAIANPSVALARANAYNALISFANRFRDDVAYRRAVAGNGMDVLDVPGANRRIYVQLGGLGGDVAEALWDAWKPALGDGVFVTRLRILGTAGWLILGSAAGDSLPCYPSSDLV